MPHFVRALKDVQEAQGGITMKEAMGIVADHCGREIFNLNENMTILFVRAVQMMEKNKQLEPA